MLEMSSTRSGLIDASNFRSLTFVDGYVSGLESRLRLTVHGERYELTSVTGSPVFYFLDFSVWYTLKGRPLTLTLKGRNLLDESVFGQRFVSSQSVSTSVSQLIPRYVMAGLEFRF
jgi:hypothetical protein